MQKDSQTSSKVTEGATLASPVSDIETGPGAERLVDPNPRGLNFLQLIETIEEKYLQPHGGTGLRSSFKRGDALSIVIKDLSHIDAVAMVIQAYETGHPHRVRSIGIGVPKWAWNAAHFNVNDVRRAAHRAWIRWRPARQGITWIKRG